LRLTRLLEHQKQGAKIISADGEQLLRYDDMLEQLKHENSKYLTRINQLESSGPEFVNLEDKNSLLKLEIDRAKGVYEKLAKHTKENEVELDAAMAKISRMESEKRVMETKLTKSSSELKGRILMSNNELTGKRRTRLKTKTQKN
jgi:predicted  nucleic acid-binding Zn-ribbon protein